MALTVTVVEDVTELARGMLSGLLYAYDLDLVNETIRGFRNKYRKCKEFFLIKGLRVNLVETEVIVIKDISKDGLCKCKAYLFGVCSLLVIVTSVLCVHCGK